MYAQQDLVGFDELDDRLKRSVFWGFLWRGLVVAVCSMVAGAIAGGVLGLVLGIVASAWGVPANLGLIRILGALAGLTIGIIAWWMYLRWLFSAKLAGFRLRLARDAVTAA